MNKSIVVSNSTAGYLYLNWCFVKDGQAKERYATLPPYALNQEIVFFGDDDAKAFMNACEGVIEDSILVISKQNDKGMNKQADLKDEKQVKKTKKVNKTIDEATKQTVKNATQGVIKDFEVTATQMENK